jgi:cyanuric acid amidohydrolase
MRTSVLKAGARALSSRSKRVPIVSAVQVPRAGETPRVLREWLERNSDARVVAVLGKADAAGAGESAFGVAVCSEMAQSLASHPPNRDHPAALMMSAGAEGVEWPRLLIFAENVPPQQALAARALAAPAEGEKRLSFATAFTRDFTPSEIGTLEQVDATREAVSRACASAGLEPHSTDVCLVKVQCPLLTRAQLDGAAAAGRPLRAETSLQSAGLSRAASALGVALACGEVLELRGDEICSNFSKFSTSAHAAAQPGLARSEVLVVGNAEGSESTLRAAKATMFDLADTSALAGALRDAGLELSRGHLSLTAHERLVCLIAKADAAALLERRPIAEPWTDTDPRASQFACASVGGALGGMIGEKGLKQTVYISGGAEHQGPAGGGPVCAIYSCLLGEEFWDHVRDGYFP